MVIADDAQDADAATRVNLRAAFVADAASRGAVAVVLLPLDLAYPRRAQAASLRLVPTTGTTPPPPTTVTSVPVVGVAQVQKRLIREDLAVRPLRLAISTTAHRGLTSHNVFGDLRGRSGPDGPLVYVSGHYDSVIGAPGANDDGSGTVLTLELARVLARLRRTNATLRFALWGSEEQGLIGSRYHVAQLAQPDRDRILGVFQNDMVATSWDPATRYWLLSFTGTANATTDAVTGAAQRLGYDAQISPVTLRGASDHQSFQEVGIASANFSWRGEATPALLEPPYHSPEDTIERNVSVDRLTVSMELIGCAAYDLGLGRHLRRAQDVAASGVLDPLADVPAAVRRDGVLARRRRRSCRAAACRGSRRPRRPRGSARRGSLEEEPLVGIGAADAQRTLLRDVELLPVGERAGDGAAVGAQH